MLVQCTRGPTSTQVGDNTYYFDIDEHGRAVAEVWNQKHADALTSVVWYRVVEKDPQPLVLTSIEPTTVELNSPDFALVCTGTGFAKDSYIVFADQVEPINFVSSEEISTIVKPSLGWGAVTVPVKVRDYAGEETAALDFTFTEAVGATQASATAPGPDPIPVTEITGIGATTASKLSSAGITDARQIAALTPDQAQALDDELGLGGRITRDDWIGQAKALIG
jgi:predicted flap endonuclease-1-like 5' DNA nuclease